MTSSVSNTNSSLEAVRRNIRNEREFCVLETKMSRACYQQDAKAFRELIMRPYIHTEEFYRNLFWDAIGNKEITALLEPYVSGDKVFLEESFYNKVFVQRDMSRFNEKYAPSLASYKKYVNLNPKVIFEKLWNSIEQCDHYLHPVAILGEKSKEGVCRGENVERSRCATIMKWAVLSYMNQGWISPKDYVLCHLESHSWQKINDSYALFNESGEVLRDVIRIFDLKIDDLVRAFALKQGRKNWWKGLFSKTSSVCNYVATSLGVEAKVVRSIGEEVGV